MIYSSLHSIADSLNNFLVIKLNRHGERAAVLSPILNQDGTIPEQALNKITFTLVKLEQDKNIRNSSVAGRTPTVPGGFNNLYVLVTAVFEGLNYDEGLKYLDASINFFNDRPVFSAANTPKLDSNILQITVSPVELSIEENSRLWATLGTKYMPSVLYLVRVEPTQQ